MSDPTLRFKATLCALFLAAAVALMATWHVGRDDRTETALRDSVRILHGNGVQLQVKYLRDTIRLRGRDSSANRWRDSVGGLLDSLAAAKARRDTVRVRELTESVVNDIPSVLAATDTARQACSLARTTCEAGWQTARGEAAAATRLTVKLEADIGACERRGWLRTAAGVGVGYLARAVTAR